MDCVTTGLSSKASRCSTGSKLNIIELFSLHIPQGVAVLREITEASHCHITHIPDASRVNLLCELPSNSLSLLYGHQVHQKSHISGECSSRVEG